MELYFISVPTHFLIVRIEYSFMYIMQTNWVSMINYAMDIYATKLT